MKTEKLVLTYQVGKEYKAERIDDVRHIRIYVRFMRKVDPAKHLLEASYYKDNSLTHAQERVTRARELYLKYWLDTSYSHEQVTFEFQGSYSRNDWYCAHIDRLDVKENEIKLLSKIFRALNTRELTTPRALIAALKSLKAVNVAYDSDWETGCGGRVPNRLGAYYEIDAPETDMPSAETVAA